MSSGPRTYEDFDALIDLLAADDSIDAPNYGYAESIGGLRDDGGHLDFAKVRSFFVQRGVNDRGEFQGVGNTHPSPDVGASGPSTSGALGVKFPSLNFHYTKQMYAARQEQMRGTLDMRPDATDPRTALDLANEEVQRLRTQYHELKLKISELFGPDRLDENFQELPGGTGQDSSHPDPRSPIEPRFNTYCPADVQSLSGDQAKQILADMMGKLSSSSYVSDQPWDVPVGGHPRSQQGCLADVKRALDFVAQTDELVWRRSRFSASNGGPAAPVFSESNIADLSQRLELWESIVRNPSPRRTG